MTQEATQPLASTATDEDVYVASQWLLMWWRFRRHKPAMVATAFVISFYVIAIAAEFFSTSDPFRGDPTFTYLRPQRIHLFEGRSWNPHVVRLVAHRNPLTRERIYEPDPEAGIIPIGFFVKGYSYKFLGIFRTQRHLFGIEDDDARPDMYILGTDRNGRDMLSRLIHATRISTSIGLVGVFISFVLGIVLGGFSGYYGGVVDIVIQRIIEIVSSIPPLPLWMGLATMVPGEWSVERTYFAIVIVLSILGWTGMARAVRGRFLSLREEDFVMAARLAGASTLRVVFRHMLPSFSSHIIAAVSLAIPGMILGETALSFLGLGLRPPAVSYGVMLQQAQNIQTVALHPWMMVPALAVVVVILSFNFMGDGLRDAADPYG